VDAATAVCSKVQCVKGVPMKKVADKDHHHRRHHQNDKVSVVRVRTVITVATVAEIVAATVSATVTATTSTHFVMRYN